MASDQRDQLTVINPWDKPFTVKWGGNPFMLNPGQQIIWPRYIAEHFAKRLTDAILLEREQVHKVAYQKAGKPMSEYIPPALLNSRRERPLVVNTILLGVYTYYQHGSAGGRAAEIQREIDGWNQPPQPQPQQPQEQQTQSREQNLGEMDDPLLGTLQDDDDEQLPPETPTAPPAGPQNMNDVITGADPIPPMQPPAQTTVPQQNVQQAQPTQPTAPTPIGNVESGLQKRNRLVKEAKQLGVKVNPGMTSEMLEEAIKKQYA